MAAVAVVDEILWEENLQDVPKSQIYTQRQWMRPTVYGKGPFAAAPAVPDSGDESSGDDEDPPAAPAGPDADGGSSDEVEDAAEDARGAAGRLGHAQQRGPPVATSTPKVQPGPGGGGPPVATSTPRRDSNGGPGPSILGVSQFESFGTPGRGSPQGTGKGPSLLRRAFAGARKLFRRGKPRSPGKGVNLDGKYAAVLQNCMQMILDADHDGLDRAKQLATETLQLLDNPESTDVQIFDQFVAALSKFFAATAGVSGVSVDPNASVSSQPLGKTLRAASKSMTEANEALRKGEKLSSAQKHDIEELMAQLEQSGTRVSNLEAAQRDLERTIQVQDDVHRRAVQALTIQARQANIARRTQVANIQRELAETQASLQGERENFAREKARLQEIIEQTNDRLFDATFDFVDRDETIKRLQAQLAAQGEQINAQLSKITELEAFDSSAESLQARLRELQEENAKLRAELKRLARELEVERVANNDLKGILRQSQADLLAERRAKGDVEAQIAARLQTALDEQEARLKAEFDKETQRLNKNAETAAKRLNEQLQKSRNNLDRFGKAHAKTKAKLNAEITQLKALIQQSYQDKPKSGGGRARPKGSRDRVRNDIDKVNARITAELATSLEQVASQQGQIESLKRALKAAEDSIRGVTPGPDATRLQQEIHELTAGSEAEMTKMDDLLLDFDWDFYETQKALEHEQEKIRELDFLLSDANRARVRLLDTLTEQKKVSDLFSQRYTTEKQKVADLEAELKRLQAEQSSETVTATDLEAKTARITQLEAQIEMTQQDLEDSQAANAVLQASQAEHAGLQERVKAVQGQLKRAGAEKEAAVAKANEDCDAEKSALERQIEDLQRQLRECLEEKRVLEAQGGDTAKHDEQIAQLDVKLASLQKQRDDDQARANAEHSRDQARIDQLTAKLQKTVARLQEATSRIAKADGELLIRDESAGRAQTELDAAGARIAELEAKTARLEAQHVEDGETLVSLNEELLETRTNSQRPREVGGGSKPPPRASTPSGNLSFQDLLRDIEGTGNHDVSEFMTYDIKKFNQLAGANGGKKGEVTLSDVFEELNVNPPPAKLMRADKKGFKSMKWDPSSYGSATPARQADISMVWSLAAFQLMFRKGYTAIVQKISDGRVVIAFYKGVKVSVAVIFLPESGYELAFYPDMKSSSTIVPTEDEQELKAEKLPYIRLNAAEQAKFPTKGEYAEGESAGVV